MMNRISLLLIALVFPMMLAGQAPKTLQQSLPSGTGQSQSTSADSTKSDTTQPALQLGSKELDQHIAAIQNRYGQLMVRDSIIITKGTFTHLWEDLKGIFQGKSQIVTSLENEVAKYVSSWGHALNLAIALLIVLALVFLFIPVRNALHTLRERWGASQVLAVNTAGYIVDIAARSLPTLMLMFGAWMVALVLSLPSGLLYTIFRIAVAIALYKFSRWFLEIVFAPEEHHERLVACDTGVARFFFHLTRAFLQWTLLYAIVILILQYIDYRSDFRYFIKYLYRIGAIVLFAVMFVRKHFAMALFPETSQKLYRRLIKLFDSFYYIIYAVLLIAGLLSVLGYFRLSGFIFTCVFYTVGILIIGHLLNRILHDGLNWIIPSEIRSAENQDEERRNFWKRVHNLAELSISAVIILFAFVFLAKVWWLLPGQSILESLLNLFTVRLFSVQSVPITPWSFIKGVIVVFIFQYASRHFRKFLDGRILDKTSMDTGAKHAVLTITHYIIVIIGFLVAIETVGIQLTTLKIFAGALGLGIGIGLQNIANNFASGLIILFERPVKNKDFVQVQSGSDGGEILGTITKISARSTTILTRDNIAIIVPNSNFIEQTVINWSLNDTPTRVHIPIGVEYGTDPDDVKKILLDIAADHKRVLKYPRPRILFKEFADSSLNFDLLIWIDDPQKGITNIKSDINFQIAKSFKANEIGIPFPQRDVHFKVDENNIKSLRTILGKPDSQERPDTDSLGSGSLELGDRDVDTEQDIDSDARKSDSTDKSVKEQGDGNKDS